MLSIKLKLFGIRLSLAGDGIGVHTVFIIHRCWRNELSTGDNDNTRRYENGIGAFDLFSKTKKTIS